MLLLSGFFHSTFHIIVFYHKTRKNSRGDNKIFARLPRAAKGFNLVCARLLFVCAVPRFAKPRSFLKKVLIVAVRKCHCGGLNRGLRNLDAPYKGIRVVTFCVVQKVTKKHTGRSPATHDSNRRSIRCFCENDRHSSGNRFCEKLQLRRVSPAMI